MISGAKVRRSGGWGIGVLLVLFNCVNLHAQELESKVFRRLTITSDTVQLDTLSIIPETFELRGLDPESFMLDAAAAQLILTKEVALPLEVDIAYRTFPFNFSEPVRHKDRELISHSAQIYNPFRAAPSGRPTFGDLDDLEKRGSISRGISVGNNQNLGVNSSLNLQLSGRLNERFSLLAAIADNNIPIQPEGNTQQLQDFDQVYLQVYDPHLRITAGDFQSQHTGGYFMRFNKKQQGARVEYAGPISQEDTTRIVHAQVSGAVSRGKFARQTIQGTEGNQGPYRLTGAEGEPFIVVLSGTERIYLDGRLLTRGQENDYIIDYNTAELVFTARVPITKDRRIVAEYQYSDRNYARSMLFSEAGFTSRKASVSIAIFSEQDSKNQPLQQNLNDAQKTVLRTIGDSLNQAVASSVDTATFSANQISYRQVDTVYFDPVRGDSVVAEGVLVFSTNEALSRFRATFSRVGAGRGNYIQGEQLATGRVYQWVPPVGGIPQGDYEPVVLLVTPKQRQMVVAAADFHPSDRWKASVEWAGSNYDVNTFSTADKSDDLGMAAHMRLEGLQPLESDWEATAAIEYELVNRHFEQIERFRTVEFDRDWNIRGLDIRDDQHIIGLELGAVKRRVFKTMYQVKSFTAGNAFRGIQNAVVAESSWKYAQGSFGASLVHQEGQQVNSDFYQHNSLLKIPVWKVQLGYKDDFEQNRRYNPASDSLNAQSYQFWEWEASVSSADSAKNGHRLSYAERTDWAKNGQDLRKSTLAKIYGYELGINALENQQLLVRINYRTLDIVNPAITNQKQENTLISRFEYAVRLWNGAVSSTTFYELGSGLENRREFIFLETVPGQGNYVHIDYNGNGQKELNEFEVAIQADQVASANFIKLFVPTNEYIKAYTNQFSQSLYLRPASVWRSSGGVRRMISKFSDQASYAVDRKNLLLPFWDQFNPFLFNIDDSLLQSTNNNLRNILYFNQSHPVFGADLTYQRLGSRNLLTSGFESRTQEKYGLGFRWNFTSILGLEVRGEDGVKTNASDAGSLSARNYDIRARQVEPKLHVQPGTRWRLSLVFQYKEQNNRLINAEAGTGAERAISRKTGFEFNLSSPEKGSVIVNANLVQISYRGPQGTAISYELLDALQPGLNATWGLSYQRTLANNLQVNFQYNGRQSPGLKTIHTGGVQARAFF